ncbi:hypothetical protein [Marivita sp. XM-24bin2]|uniref:hypothetical protein n=1 Tax=Marivita sp. XM-24bin2 TaxID=2133951 RepID=UPI0025BE203B|nr:hypothetical protein [Marivita sp. XM-24bin2]
MGCTARPWQSAQSARRDTHALHIPGQQLAKYLPQSAPGSGFEVALFARHEWAGLAGSWLIFAVSEFRPQFTMPWLCKTANHVEGRIFVFIEFGLDLSLFCRLANQGGSNIILQRKMLSSLPLVNTRWRNLLQWLLSPKRLAPQGATLTEVPKEQI